MCLRYAKKLDLKETAKIREYLTTHQLADEFCPETSFTSDFVEVTDTKTFPLHCLFLIKNIRSQAMFLIKCVH